jgi:gas vesicle protein
MTAKHALDNPLLAEHAAEIRRLGKRVVEDVLEIGRRLTECKKLVGHGNWLPWIEREFGWTDDTALNFMRVYEVSKSRNFRDLSLPVSALYLLAAPSTPKEARDKIIERAQAGETIPVAEVKRTIEHAKGRRKAAAKVPPKANSRVAQVKERVSERVREEAEKTKPPREIEELCNAKRRLEIENTGLRSEIEELKTERKPASDSKAASRCSICHEKKQAALRPVFICDRCVATFEVHEAAEQERVR